MAVEEGIQGTKESTYGPTYHGRECGSAADQDEVEKL